MVEHLDRVVLSSFGVTHNFFDFAARTKRNAEGNLVTVRAETDLTDDELQTVIEVAESLDFMIDPDKFTEYFLSSKKNLSETETYSQNTDWFIWANAANTVIKRELDSRGMSENKRITNEFETIVDTVKSVVKAIILEEQHAYQYPPYTKKVVMLDHGKEITYQSKCAGKDLARPWVNTALEVIRRNS